VSSQRSQSPLNITLLAGPNRVLREFVLEQLIAQAHSDSRQLMVLTFDRQRALVPADRNVGFRCAEAKQIKIAQPGQIVPFRADLFLELSTIWRKGLVDDVVIELPDNCELPSARDTLTHRFPGGIYLGDIARLTRSIIMLEGLGLPGVFWTKDAASEPEKADGPNSESAFSRGHRVARSIECADMVVLTDSMTIEPADIGRAVRVLRGLNPALAIADTRLFRFDSIPVMGSVEESLPKPSTGFAVCHSEVSWVVFDEDFARITIQATRPLHPQRFYEFVKGGWRGVLRGRGRVQIASQPGTSRLWSQAGQVGVLGSKRPTVSGERVQNLMLVGAPQACVDACNRFEECLLDDEEMELGSRLWCAFSDPLKEG
jgi:Cobalamin synthesis protein cobW C-terminal domain